MKKQNQIKKDKKGFTLPTLILLLSVPSNAIATEDFFDMSLESLMDIEVTSVSKRAEKISEAPAAIYVITNEDLRRSGHNSIPEALRMVPGLNVARTDSNKWAISARGFNRQFSNKLLVLIDGRSVYTPLFSGVYWDAQDYPLEDIERIEVIRGPGATLWGANAVNGVINIITKKAKDTQGSLVHAGFGNHERANITARHGGKYSDKAHYRIYAKYNSNDEFETPTGADANDHWYTRRAGFRIDTDENLRDSYTFQGDIYHGKKDYSLVVPSLTAPFFSPVADNRTSFQGGNLIFKWNRNVSETSDTSLQIYYDYINRDISTVIGQKRHTFDIDFQHNWNFNDRNQITWGAEFRYWTDDLTESGVVNYNKDSDDHKVFSAFIQDKISVIPEKLFLTIGSKFEHNDYTGFEFQPSVRSSWLIDKAKTLWASISRAVRTPTRNENNLALAGATIPPAGGLPAALLSLNGNNSIESEEVVAYEIGYRTKPTEKISLDITAFFNDYDDLDTFETGTPFLNTSNTFLGPHLSVPLLISNNGSGESYGIEVAGSWNITEIWKVAASYTYLTVNLHTDTGSTDTLLETDEGKTPHNQFNIRSYLDITDSVEWDNSLYYVDNLSSFGIKNYIRFDSRIGWKPTDFLELSLVGQNLFDEYHTEFGESIYATPSQIGRTFYGKAVVRF